MLHYVNKVMGISSKTYELCLCGSYNFPYSFETVGLQKILQLLESDDANIRIHAVKVVANLAAEGKFCIISEGSVSLTSALGPQQLTYFDKQRQIRKRS